MANSNDPMDQMKTFWKEGQDAFFDAQKNMAENFGRAFAPKPKDPVSQSVEAWQDFVKAWAPGWDPAAMMQKQAKDHFASQRDAFFAIYDPATWMTQAPDQLRSILESVSQFPKLADMALPQAEGAEQWQEMLDFQEATGAFATIMQDAWKRTYARFSKNFSLEDLKSGNVAGSLDAWVKTANEELMDTQASDEFMEAQRALIRAGNGLKQRQAKVAEAWSDAYQMPTRSEVDDLAKTVTELKREVRALKRKLGQG